MKKHSTIFLIFTLFFLLISLPECNNSKKKDRYVVGFSQIGTESDWRIANTDEMREAFDNHPRFTMIYSDAQQRRDNQVSAIRSFIQQKVDAIIFAPIVATGWDVILSEAKDAGIPVIVINRAARMISGNIEKYTVCLVAPDNVYAGEILAKSFIEAFGDEPGPVYVAEMTGTSGSSSSADRGRGIHTILDNSSHIIIRYSQTGDYSRVTAAKVMENILLESRAEGIKLRGLISHNDDMAIGASQAIEEAGLIPGRDILIAGIDGTNEAIEAIREGRYTITVENPLGYGNKTIEILLDLLDNGKKPDNYWVVLKNEVYTADSFLSSHF